MIILLRSQTLYGPATTNKTHAQQLCDRRRRTESRFKRRSTNQTTENYPRSSIKPPSNRHANDEQTKPSPTGATQQQQNSAGFRIPVACAGYCGCKCFLEHMSLFHSSHYLQIIPLSSSQFPICIGIYLQIWLNSTSTNTSETFVNPMLLTPSNYPPDQLQTYTDPPAVPPNVGQPGEMGSAVHFPPDQQKLLKKRFKEHEFNILASEAILYNRSLPDIRSTKCVQK